MDVGDGVTAKRGSAVGINVGMDVGDKAVRGVVGICVCEFVGSEVVVVANVAVGVKVKGTSAAALGRVPFFAFVS